VQPRFNISAIAWGCDYLELMEKVSLPALAAPQNLPETAKLGPVKCSFLTTQEDAEKIEKWEITKYLRQFAEVEISGDLDKLSNTGNPDAHSLEKYNLWSKALNKHLAQCYEEKAWWVMWPPDSLFANGTLSTIYRRASEGVKAVSVGCNQVVHKENFLADLAQQFDLGNGLPLSLENRQLAAFSLKNFHPAYHNNTLNFAQFTTWPAILYFPVPGEGLLVRLFHSSPLAIKIDRPVSIDPGDTIDMMFLEKLIDSVEEIYYATDSDELCTVNLAPGDFKIPTTSEGPSKRIIKNFINKHTNEIHRQHALQSCYWHATDITPEKWKPLEELSDKFIKMMNSTVDPNFVEDQGFRRPPDTDN